MQYYWHNIGKPIVGDHQDVWASLVKNGVIETGFSHYPDEKGREILRKYQIDDVIFVYANGHGLVGVCQSKGSEFYRLEPNTRNNTDHRHELAVNWLWAADHVGEGVAPATLWEHFGLRHPRQTSQRVDASIGRQLLGFLQEEFGFLLA